MKHALRKYLSRRGSALFMVLSLMTALMILVMAMYFSVVSSRDVQHKVFYQEQAYRSADALSNAIILGLGEEGGWKAADGTINLLSAMTNLQKPGDSITTNGNGFSALDLNGTKEEEDQIGAYSATITRLEDETINEKTVQVYDVAITVSVGGVLETTHTYIRIEPPEGEIDQGKANIFTSTGYVPNDVFLDNVETRTDLFYDNEFVIVTGESHILGNINCGGSLKLHHMSQSPGQASNVATWAIRNIFTNNNNVSMGPDSANKGQILVGGDAIFAGGVISNADIYVGHNAVFTSSTNFNNCRLFVQGNLVFESSSTLPGTIYASGTTNNTGYNIGSVKIDDIWDENTRPDPSNPASVGTLPADVMTDKEMRDKLDKLTATREYPKWEIDSVKDGKAEDDLYYIPELDSKNVKPADAESNAGYYNPKTITFDGSHYTYYLDWETGHSIPDYFGKGQPLNYTACSIEDIVMGDTNGWPGNKSGAIVIDTGDDPKNQYIIKLNANRDFVADKNNELDSFSWMPENGGLVSMTIIVRGCGSVVFDIPENVTYQASSYTTVIHETWYAILGGKISQLGAAGNRNTLSYTQNSGSAVSFKVADAMAFIHTGCDENCDDCNYVVNKNADTCSKCNKAMTKITCDYHKVVYNYCPECKPGYEPNKDISGNYYGLCANYLERSAVEEAVSNLSADWKTLLKESVSYVKEDGTIASESKDKLGDSAMFSGDTAQWYYPTTNIFLVSTVESADIRLANAPDGTTLSNAHFWGFVYAPYMTYRGKGNSAGWAVFCGGMIVSDYIVENFDVYLSCYPSQMPDQLMNWEDQQEMLEGYDDKKWKVSLAGF